MILNTREWGPEGPERIVCIHGITQEAGIFDELGEKLGRGGASVLAVDLRGHGRSGKEPPWSTETHAQDILETLDAMGAERVTWIGHSYGGRLAALLAHMVPERTLGLALLDPAMMVTAERALRQAEIERLDWSFATVDGAIQAMLSADSMVAPPHDVVTEFVRANVEPGPDGRYRFRFCPSAVVVAWSEMTLPPPPIARCPTLLVRAAASLSDGMAAVDRYSEALGESLTLVEVPNGHNVLWEAPTETIGAVERYLSLTHPEAGH